MKYNYGAFRYPGQGMRALLNILHLRHLFEFILSLATGRITGALQDSMAIKAVFQFPQAILQTLLWYYGNYSTTNEALSLFSVLGSLLCIAAVPHSTPCFEDRYRRNDLGFEGEISRINSRSRNSSTRTDEKDQNQRI
mmetsp:Transcript_18194/g.25247  ORF Transcript_18194/g.25247 Transcript_18194/m.25247 type:complete len:138 (+) Transcript_18194:574-987(+)